MVTKLFKKSLTFLPTIIVFIFVSLSWSSIEFEFKNPNEINGYYNIFKYSYLNDNIRYVVFISFPLITYLITLIYQKKIKINFFKKILIFDFLFNPKKNILNKFFILLFFAQIFIFLSQNLNYYPIDLFHEGQALSGALNLKFTDALWSESFVVTSLFVDLLNANIAWKLFNIQSISSYRLLIDFLILFATISSYFLIYQLSSSSNLNKNFKLMIFIILVFFVYSLFKNNTLGYRELPIFIFLISVYELIVNRKIGIINLAILGSLPIIGVLWSLDRGIFLIAGYIPLLIILICNKKFKELFLIFLFCLIANIVLIISIGFKEFTFFLTNSLDILKSSDLLNGIIHPSPFSEQDGSTRATKSLIIIILNGIFLINYLFKQNNNLNKNFKIFLLIYYFLSIIFYKIGITRSDGGHIKQGVSLNTILLLYFVLIYFFNFLESRKKSIKYNHKIIKIVNIFLIFLFIFNNIPKNFLYNVFNIKDRYIEYIKTPDLNFLSLKEKKLIKKLRSLTVDENCIQIFTYETAISYYLQKPSCTKFYHIMNMGSKSNQFEFIKEIKDSSSKLIIVGGTYEKIGNIKGRDKIELSPKDRFPYIEEYLIKHYKELEIFEDWKILIKIN
tara:strand:- start:1600 stop:3450 length:1851 start_codon:yes stop_codon:yes gene_type:complete